MKDFAELIKTLDSTNKTTLKVEALTHYFKNAADKDKVWTIAILSHRRPPRPVNTTLMRQWASELANIPLWLFEESYHIVGDLAETIALVIPPAEENTEKSLNQFLQEILELKPKAESEKKDYLHKNWLELNYYERFVFTKLITGSFRIGVSQKLMTRALSKATDIDEDILAYKMMGNWKPEKTTFKKLILEENEEDYLSKPYPFYLAYAIDDEIEELGDVANWSAEHKWDGIRSQVIIRNDELFVWSRGEELVTDKYPEFEDFVGKIPNGTVIDGEILPFPDGKIGTFKDLQTRIGRKNISKKLLEKTPVILKAYDVLEWKGVDIRTEPFVERRKILEKLYAGVSSEEVPLHLSERISFKNWAEVAEERERAREEKSEGLMLKRLDSPYLVGRKKGDWWKWKVDPLTVDAVLTYAMRGHGRRSNLFTDYTFGLWNDDKKELVTFAKAYSGLTDAEFRKLDAWIKKNTLERFGPVRSVTPHHVFEIAFEGIAESKRHKSGVATRFPRMVRWRTDKNIHEANTLGELRDLIPD
ncbi:ATP-dependent DNA ligase [Salegentibacter mishustinae]|uniref:DNA ligase (ATP) n=1 Tax=Salegentibacter mishustinae TaxID=270918 RepID=A0A0Q9ZD68_9FLAO|nr:ATP-dependent DNA ligase [Salegentibacter mishustinae]KRG27434.1 ATP-dependent DNA ligase [Salegentibacter mishustinae]PNW20508.1 ATP-dependent DNA ligase [Salegentibacter mishustinae]PZX63313.1 DNA ligase-1 [Salegentibacter mishustinae]GGW93267.1 ATP-dependent DNA ligase [Salegentibacter mishustinae]